MEEYQFKFMTVQLEERADAMREYAHEDNTEKCSEALSDIERLIPQLKSFLNDKRNVQRGEEKSSKKPIGGYTLATWCETITKKVDD